MAVVDNVCQLYHAAAPFDHAKVDVILRSSDNVHFRIFKLFLSLVSPFFKTFFGIPRPVDENGDQGVRDGLAALLRFCYQCTLAEEPKIDVFEGRCGYLGGCQKIFSRCHRKEGSSSGCKPENPKILEVEPLRCFAIAHRGRLREEAILAAKYTLTQALIPSWFQEIEFLAATDLLSLLMYHKRCGEAVYALRLDLDWIKSHYGSSRACSWLSGQYQKSNLGPTSCNFSKIEYTKVYGVRYSAPVVG